MHRLLEPQVGTFERTRSEDDFTLRLEVIDVKNLHSSRFSDQKLGRILALIDQMNPAERRDYLAESLFLNSVTYENEMLSAYVRRLAAPPKAPSARSRAVNKPRQTKRKPR